MDHFVSTPILLSEAQAATEFRRADLVFYEVDARGRSFIARVFVDPPGDTDTSPDRQVGYAGFFAIFGHGGCFGDLGHCDVPTERDPFDPGPPHPLSPQTKVVDITKRLTEVGGESVIVTVLAIAPSRPAPRLVDALQFTDCQLLSYQ
jgi:tyrosinase